MISSFFILNYMPLMILLALIAMMFVNRDVKIPATKLFAASVVIMIVLMIISPMKTYSDVSGLSPEAAAEIVRRRLLASTLDYVLRPVLILLEILIILNDSKHRLLCVIPAVLNGAIYSTSLFGGRLAFYISGDNHWGGGPLRLTIFVTQIFYLVLLLVISFASFNKNNRRKSTVLLIMCVQAVVTVLLEYNGVEPSYTDAITALCMLEYYIYLSTVYRQGLKDKLDTYVTELNATNLKLENFSKEVITAFVNSIDAKDTYTHGHSARVAEYSRRLAEMNGKSEEECDEIYYAALLHDIGKIGISESIITKEGKLTKEEYESIKLHPVLGAQILGSISEFPYLQVGARYHHERYDGKGYPEGLEGKDIPEMGRIIAVADAYDAMSSKRSYRDPIPQQKVREEIVKGTGTQFDPEYARLMLHLIDEDLEYEMSENVENTDLNGQSELVIGEYRSWTSDGILITPCKTTINLSVTPGPGSTELNPAPALLLFDSLDGKVHTDEKEKKDLNYFEYGEITNVLQAVTLGTRKMEARKKNKGLPELKQKERFRIEAVRIEDHAMITISDRKKSVEFIVALPDSTRYLYIGLTGEHCTYSNIELFKAETESPVGLIPRIAEKISYLDGPEGDVPSIQVDGYRTAHSEGVPVKDGLKISFHIKTLPTARLVWHCPFIDIYCSDDGAVNGASYRDLAFTRFDGECWECDPSCHAELNVKMTDRFRGWDAWKEFNREGYDATVTFRVEDDRITVITENAGIAVSNMFTITGIEKTIYAAVTGDQVAVTDIRIGG